MDGIDETLDLLAKAKVLAERIKAREAEQAHDRRALDRVLRLLGMSGGGAFDPGYQPQVPPPTPHIDAARAVATGFLATMPGTWAALDSVARAFVARQVPNAPPGVPTGELTAEPPPKYDVILQLIASGRFDIGMAARAIYGDDSERSRNRVRAGINHLRDRSLVVRHPDGTLTAVHRRLVPDANAPAGKREG